MEISWNTYYPWAKVSNKLFYLTKLYKKEIEKGFGNLVTVELNPEVNGYYLDDRALVEHLYEMDDLIWNH